MPVQVSADGRRSRWRDDTDPAAHRNEHAACNGCGSACGFNTSVDRRGAGKSVQDNFQVTLQVAIRREWNVNDISGLQGNICCFAPDYPLVVDDSNLWLGKRTTDDRYMMQIGSIKSSICARNRAG